MRSSAFRRDFLAALSLAVFTGLPALGADEITLRFERDGALVREIDRATLAAACGVTPILVEADPYYEKPKHFLACPLITVLELGFGKDLGPPDLNYFFRARDGYMKSASGAQLLESGGWLALSDIGTGPAPGQDPLPPEIWIAMEPVWEPIGRSAVDPGPFYVVWTGADQSDVHRYPWPYQLAAIEISGFDSQYPHTVPRGAVEGDPALAGFAIFRTECVSCHAINGEGGKVGPDLNVPRSIVEYRPAEQIKAFIRDPQSFRYTSMPSHLHLSARDLDSLVAYFQTMKNQKYDPAMLLEERVGASPNSPGKPVGTSPNPLVKPVGAGPNPPDQSVSAGPIPIEQSNGR
jgi:mono/diheme cytochrome c family protein